MDQSIASQNDPNVLIVPEESALILIELPRRNGARHSQTTWRQVMTSIGSSEAAKEVVRRNTEEVQSGGNFEVFDELFADDFLDHTPQPGRTPDKEGARQLYKSLRSAFPISTLISIGKLPMATA